MTGILAATVITEADTAVGAPELLTTFAEAGMLHFADVRTAMRFGQLLNESDQDVLLACALTVRALRSGSVCLDLSTISHAPVDLREGVSPADLPWPEAATWGAKVAASSLCNVGAESDDEPRPLRLVDGLLYLERYWLQEEEIRQRLIAFREAPAPYLSEHHLVSGLDALFTRDGLAPQEPDLQRVAAALSNAEWLTVIAGGPGTGKTTTVARLLALLVSQHAHSVRIALAAPTGKAAARLTEAVREAVAQMPEPWRSQVPPVQAVTLHRLLGFRMHEPQPRHHEFNPLPYDIVIVDEMSMVSLTLMDALLRAVRPPSEGQGSRLILIGDPNQLTSVEAGAVLADICAADHPTSPRLTALLQRLAPHEAALLGHTGGQVVELTHTWRFGGRLQQVAEAVRVGDADLVVDLLTAPVTDPTVDNAQLVDTDLTLNVPTELQAHAVHAGEQLIAAAEAGDAASALASLSQHRLLCAHRSGPYGVSRWGREVEAWLGLRVSEGEWQPGLPVMVTQNDPDLGLYNGDTGVVIASPEGPRVVFTPNGTHWPPTLLDNLVTVHAMTIHKAQGSQFDRVSVVLPPVDSPLLTRELVYTALTRAAKAVDVYGSVEALRTAVSRPANRASGLRERLSQK